MTFTGRFCCAIVASNSPTGEAINGRARIFVTSDRLWQVLALATQDSMDQDQINAFFESFKVAVEQ